MLSRKNLAIASLCTIVCTHSVSAEEAFKSSKFLTYPADTQKSYIITSVVMAGIISGQNKPDQSKCIDSWMGENEPIGFSSVKEVMARYPNHHPSGVIVAVLEKACGSVKYGGQ